ncbi:hypothetical protein PHMEG_00013873 [Phytophthora megakarya]|uniref:Uncharacterized protein n=1 Tax=Phytophthora megakarya TaxID=4795 RepID=A0A225W573_9STRA|nr:hypothetical protein PHMEG_00013873 [Phytophthora megakarya]
MDFHPKFPHVLSGIKDLPEGLLYDPSEVEYILPAAIGDGNDTLAMFGTLLQRQIFVISPNPDITYVNVQHFEPKTMSEGKTDHATCVEYRLSLDECVKSVI